MFVNSEAGEGVGYDIIDANALDIVVGPGQTQSEVMDWRAHSPVALPVVPLTP